MQYLILYDLSSNMKFSSVQDFLGFYYLEDTVREAMSMGQDPAFQVIDRLAVMSDISTTNQVPSDREIVPLRELEERRSKGIISAKSKLECHFSKSPSSVTYKLYDQTIFSKAVSFSIKQG